jgi:hypothetical protein
LPTSLRVQRHLSEAEMDTLVELGAETGALHETESEMISEIIKLGESAPEPLRAGERPLSGVRVLDLTRILAGPTHARTLAEHGADVLYIASPWLPNPDAFVMDTNHGKLSAYLDLDEPATGLDPAGPRQAPVTGGSRPGPARARSWHTVY